MRGAILAIFLAPLAVGGIFAAATPAAARDYAYCLQGSGYGIPGDCSYSTYAQCQASASGRRAGCNINPRVAFARQGAGQSIYGDDNDYRPLRRSRHHRYDDGYGYRRY